MRGTRPVMDRRVNATAYRSNDRETIVPVTLHPLRGDGPFATADQSSSSGESELARLISEHDWSVTPLGPMDGRPSELRTLVSMVVGGPHAMFIAWGRDRTLIYNDAYAAILQDCYPAALGRSYREVWSDIAAEVEPIIANAVAGVPTRMDEIALTIHRGGERVEAHFAFSNSPIRLPDGTVAGNFCICQETTDTVFAARVLAASAENLARAEAEVRAERDRSREILDSISDGMFLLDRDLRVLAINAAGVAIDGRPAEAIIGRSLLEVWPATRDTPTLSLVNRVMAERQHGQVTYQRANVPIEQWIRLNVYPVAGGTAIFYRNVTVAKRAADALAASEAEFRAMAENLPNLCWIADATGHVYWYNKGWFEYTGTVAEDMVGWGWQAVHDPELLPQVLETWTALIERGERFEMTFPLKGADGVFRPFLTRIAPVRDAAGAITHWCGNNVDVSEVTTLARDLARSEARYRATAEAWLCYKNGGGPRHPDDDRRQLV